jgi:hypothetical protein
MNTLLYKGWSQNNTIFFQLNLSNTISRWFDVKLECQKSIKQQLELTIVNQLAKKKN